MLQDLPVELLSQIVSHFPTAAAVFHLSLTSRALHVFVEKEGWKVFSRSKFPSIPIGFEANHREASHALTSLSRNWDRRAFLARYLEPSGAIVDLESRKQVEKWKKPGGQTMGYQPVMDSYDESTGPSWSARREVLAWGAGAELIIRVKHMGQEYADFWDRSAPEERDFYYDDRGHMVNWFTYKAPGAVQGRDDITSLNILKPFQKETANDNIEKMVVGTADGELSLRSVDLSGNGKMLYTSFNTDERPVRSADISPSTAPLLAACIDESTVALYRIPVSSDIDSDPIQPINEICAIPDSSSTRRVWSTKFLSSKRLAVGLGPSVKPIHIYDVSSDGISDEPVRKFSMQQFGMDDRVAQNSHMHRKPFTISVYPITSLPPSAVASRPDGEVYLSGGYDGTVRLHDMRSRLNFETQYSDPAEDAAIYSLLCLGRERLVAGNSRNSLLKVFDMRMAGGRVYHYIDAKLAHQSHFRRGSSPSHAINGVTESTGLNASNNVGSTGDWNLFLSPRSLSGAPTGRNTNRWGTTWTRRSSDSPIYSLSAPSFHSPSIFAGVENAVIQLDFVSMLDRHPDPIFNPCLQHGRRIPRKGSMDVRRIWDPKAKVLDFAMYEQGGTGAMRLRVQRGVGEYAGNLDGYDERWRDSGRF